MQIFRACGVIMLIAWLASTSPAAGQSPGNDVDRYGLLADESIKARGLTIVSGDVGVNRGPLSSTRPLDAPASALVAEFVDLDPASRCDALFVTSGRGTAQCGPPQPFDGPIVADVATACGFPADMPACTPDRPISVLHGADEAEAPGEYGRVQVSGGGRGPGTLRLAPGRYVFCDLDVARNGRIEVDGDTEIIVTGSVSIDNGARIGRDPGSTDLADLVRVFVGGDDVGSRARRTWERSCADRRRR